MAESRHFDIVGHLDLIKVFKFLPTDPIEVIAAPAMEAIKRADMAIELNVAGYRKPVAEPYPSETLLKMARELDIPVTFGSDAHKPEQVGLYREKIESFARSAGYSECALYRNRIRELVTF
jgi:histidinol-phosphatase (PHP family)